MLYNESTEEKLSYWQSEFVQIPPELTLLPVRKISIRPTASKYGSGYIEYRLEPGFAKRIKKLRQRVHVTPTGFYLAVLRVLLTRLTGAESMA